MQTDDIQKRLASIVDELNSLRAAISGSEPSLPEKAKELVAEGICLDCGKPLAGDSTAVRGLHGSCYRKIKRLIEVGEISEQEAINAGVLAPSRPAGRPKKLTRVQQYIEQKKRSQFDELASSAVAEMAADLDAAVARDKAEQAAKPPASKPNRGRKKKGA